MANKNNIDIADLSHKTFDKFLETDKVAVVYFWASWCEPCGQFKEIYSAVSGKSVFLSKVAFASVDIEKEKELASDFGIRSVPTIIVFRDKIALSVESGVLSEKDLLDLVDEALALDMKKVHEQIAKKIIE